MRPDAQATLDRWPSWTLAIAFSKPGRLLWRGVWRGPQGGRYTYWSLTKGGVERHVERELARWTKLRRRIGDSRHVVHPADVQTKLRWHRMRFR